MTGGLAQRIFTGIFSRCPLHTHAAQGMIAGMTTVTTESLHTIVARRLRGLMGEQRLSQDKVAKLCGWGRGYMNRRYIGETPLDVNDMAALEIHAGISMRYLLTGESPVSPNPSKAVSANGLPDPADYLRNRLRRPQQRLPLPRLDSNQEPVGYRLPCRSPGTRERLGVNPSREVVNRSFAVRLHAVRN